MPGLVPSSVAAEIWGGAQSLSLQGLGLGLWEDSREGMLVLVLAVPSLQGTLGTHMQDLLGFLSAYSLPGMSGSPTKRWKLWQHPLKQ